MASSIVTDEIPDRNELRVAVLWITRLDFFRWNMRLRFARAEEAFAGTTLRVLTAAPGSDAGIFKAGSLTMEDKSFSILLIRREG